MAELECAVVTWMYNVSILSCVERISGSNKDFSEQKIYLTTHTSEGEQNYLMQATIQMPLPDSTIDMREFDNDGNGIKTWTVIYYRKRWFQRIFCSRIGNGSRSARRRGEQGSLHAPGPNDHCNESREWECERLRHPEASVHSPRYSVPS